MSSSKTRQILALLLQAVILIDTAVVAVNGILCGAGGGQVGDDVIGLGYFKPFTMDSNILAAFSALFGILFGIRALRRGTDTAPKWTAALHLMAAASLSLTFLIAGAFLGPVEAMSGKSYFIMFRGDMFFFHLVNPLLSILCFLFLRPCISFRRRDCVLGAVPTFLYSIVYLVMVVFLKRWDDFYHFTFGGRYALIPAVILVVYALILGLSLLLIHGRNRAMKRIAKA